MIQNTLQKWPQVRKSRYGKVNLYWQKRSSKDLYTITWYVGHQRVRETTADLVEAQTRADEIMELFKLGNPPKEPRKRKTKSIKNWSHIIGDVPMEEVVKHYAQTHDLLPSITVDKVCTAYLLVKTNSGVGARYRQTLRSHLNRFSGYLGSRTIASITAAELDKYLAGFLDMRTRFNHRASLRGLFKWAKNQNYVHKSVAEDTELPKYKIKAPELFSATELGKLFEAAGPKELPMLIAGAYAGLRMSEIARIRWSDINWEERAFVLGPEMTKTNRSRMAHFPESIEGLLRRLAVTAKLCDRQKLIQDNCTDIIRKLTERSGVEWKKNGLRKTFISCRIALTRNAAEVAEQCGNSPTVIQQHYKGLVTKSEAEAWFKTLSNYENNSN